ncbi:hypothetical protein BN8_00805 [Fibrisoma limi BUZ 3]|uniref:Uncharacterized protein n=1 Tax=Fibrisoma limi BUZ 3 TaxID=1185876 RepID=I2GD78_9BACT|nr:hypothetical protein BN8_00805 [Fibrisoma limi BUZ 3]
MQLAKQVFHRATSYKKGGMLRLTNNGNWRYLFDCLPGNRQAVS